MRTIALNGREVSGTKKEEEMLKLKMGGYFQFTEEVTPWDNK